MEIVDPEGERHRLPLPPKAQPEEKGAGASVYRTTATAVELRDYLQRSLPDAGWTLVDVSQVPRGIMAVLRRGDKRLQVLSESGINILRGTSGDNLTFTISTKVEPSALERDLDAIKNLADAGGADKVEELVSLLDDSRAPVRREAVSALATIADERSLKALAGKLDDDDSGVRQRAAIALGKLGSAQAVDALIAGLEGRDHLLGAPCAWALGEIRDRRAVTPLITALEKPYRETRLHSALALGDIGDTAAVEPLVACLKDERNKPMVTAAALASLTELLDRDELSALVRTLPDRSSAPSPNDAFAENVSEAATEILFDVVGI